MLEDKAAKHHFFRRLKDITEKRWRHAAPDLNIIGFQFQAGTCWNAGLSELDISSFEAAIGAKFPDDYQVMLKIMNGTDLPTINTYGSEAPSALSVGVYSYPQDLALIQEKMQNIAEFRSDIEDIFSDEESFQVFPDDVLVPIYGHRYLVCSADSRQSMVLSIVGSDAIVYGTSLIDYLKHEFEV
jgi:hypothetical protein